jgi:hypothetical protein
VAATAPRAYWDYVHDPHGLKGLISDQRDTMAHGFARFGSYVESYNGVHDPRCTAAPLDGCYGIRLNPAVDDIARMVQTDRTGVSTLNPPFAGKTGFADGNNVQSHPSGMGLQPANEREREFFMDARPFNGEFPPGDPKAPQAVRVSGMLWKFPAGPNGLKLDRKFLPTLAQSGWHPLIDISGPASSLADTADGNYKYCVVQAAGECHGDSVVGEVYFNVPFLRYNYCLYSGQAGNAADSTDICIDNLAFVTDNLVQIDMKVGADNAGAGQRALTKGFGASKMNAPFWNVSVLPNNKWAIFRTRFVNDFRPEVMLMKLPPLDQDSENRTGFVPLGIPVANVPEGTDNVVVEFGYAENGAPGDFFCTSRQEACVAGNSIRHAPPGRRPVVLEPENPFYFAASEADMVAGMPCASSCTVRISALPQHVVYYRVLYRDSAGQALGVTDLGVQAAP